MYDSVKSYHKVSYFLRSREDPSGGMFQGGICLAQNLYRDNVYLLSQVFRSIFMMRHSRESLPPCCDVVFVAGSSLYIWSSCQIILNVWNLLSLFQTSIFFLIKPLLCPEQSLSRLARCSLARIELKLLECLPRREVRINS